MAIFNSYDLAMEKSTVFFPWVNFNELSTGPCSIANCWMMLVYQRVLTGAKLLNAGNGEMIYNS